MKLVRRTFPVLFVVLCLLQAAVPQTRGKLATNPFLPGEVLVYEGKLSKFLSNMSVAELRFTVRQVSGTDNYLINTEARDKGTLLKFFRFSFLQQYETTIDGNHFRVIETKKHDVQKDRIRNSEAFFNYEDKRVTFVETDPKDQMRPPRKIASTIDDSAQDLVSGIYAIRRLPLAVGQSYEFTVSDSGLTYRIPVKVTARELQKTVLGKLWCFRVEPDVFGPGRIIEKEGSMVIWFTDDARRIPVRSQINADIGKIDIKLRALLNNG